MEISIREWSRDDVSQVAKAWLDYCKNGGRADMQLSPTAEGDMRRWLTDRIRQENGLGLVAVSASAGIVGFLIARIDDFESVPPVIQPRRIGIIDGLYVSEEFRRQGIGSMLVDRAIETMKASKVVAVETIYEAWNDASVRAWHRAGFAPWMVHAYRIL